MLSPSTRCQIIPLPHQQFDFRIDGKTKTTWHFGADSPRPFFYPVHGPSGVSLTRMGHPGAPNHDHHRSLWFAHHDLLGIDFWSENTAARIEQARWYAIDEQQASATIAFELLWRDGHDPSPLLRQDVIATIRPGMQLNHTELPSEEGGSQNNGHSSPVSWTLELQCDFRATSEGVAFQQSNFGVLALRVAKSLSVIFGQGVITGANGRTGEQQLFGRPNRWIDYSGPVGTDASGKTVIEGITLVDHADNPHQNGARFTSWHVRDDGWIGPSLSRHEALELQPSTSDMPPSVRCRYLLIVHNGRIQPEVTNRLADSFDASPYQVVSKSTEPHRQYRIATAK